MIVQSISKLNTCTNMSFKKKTSSKHLELEDDNPISRKGEIMNLIKTTFIGGLILGGKLLFEILDDGDFLIESIGDYSQKVVNASKKEKKKLYKDLEIKKKNIKIQKTFHGIGAFVALLASGLCGFAILYTALNAPKIAYNSKVNTFRKQKEMDVYIKANDVECELYTQLDNQAKNATEEEKENLKAQYLQLKYAKNQVPDFVKLK